MNSNRISYLFTQLEEDSITADEREELYALLRSFENNDDILTWLENSYQNTIPRPIDKEKWKPILEKILGHKEHNGYTKSTTSIKRMYKWIAAAAIIIIIAATAIVISKRSEKSPRTEVAKTHDVAPPSNTRAVITLANGQKVYLDSVNNGTIAQENNVNVVKNEKGEIIYSHEGAKSQSEIVYNTLFNPRGSKVISLTLSDGTKVWLNSESSLRYPASFAPSAVSREVEITGEAYFEVKHDAKQPFKVHLPNGSIVEDIGTAFNINSYPDEDGIKTTLIEGSVRVSAELSDLSFSAVILKPNQQSVQIPQASVIRVQKDVDLEKITAWKNNEFNFEEDDIQTIMRQLARWYNIQPVITAPSDMQYTGRITRDVPLSEVLKMFERVGYVKFEITDRVVKVIPVK